MGEPFSLRGHPVSSRSSSKPPTRLPSAGERTQGKTPRMPNAGRGGDAHAHAWPAANAHAHARQAASRPAASGVSLRMRGRRAGCKVARLASDCLSGLSALFACIRCFLTPLPLSTLCTRIASSVHPSSGPGSSYPMCFPLSARVSCLLYSSHMVAGAKRPQGSLPFPVSAPYPGAWNFLSRLSFPPLIPAGGGGLPGPGRRRSLVAPTN